MQDLAPPTPTLDPIPDDAALLRRAVAGDGEAFAEIHARHGAAAHAAARRILGPTPAAEDAVQDALLQLWRTGESYRPERGSLRSWLIVLVRSRALDLLRREQVRTAAAERVLAAVEGERHVRDDDPYRAARAREVRTSIASLPREQAQVLGLMYLAGRTQSEVATVLDLPLGTVKGRSRLGLARLRREMLAEAA